MSSYAFHFLITELPVPGCHSDGVSKLYYWSCHAATCK